LFVLFFKAKIHTCTLNIKLKRTECLLCLFLEYVSGHVINILCLPFVIFLYLAYRGRWLGLTCGSPEVWGLGPKLWFHSLPLENAMLLKSEIIA
jgi:hypothetical protein